MSMKSILVPMESDAGMESVLSTAVLLARRHDSYIEGFSLRWTIDFALVEAFAAAQYERELETHAQRARQTFESFMRKNDVPRSSKGTTSLSFGWLDEPLSGETVVGTYGRAFDVIVMNRPSADSPGLYRGALESGLFESGRPMLLSPPTPPQRIGTNVLIAWNGSTEQARAMALSMPLLESADRVTMLTVTGGTEVPGPSAGEMIRYLQLNGVRSQRLTVELGEQTTGECVLDTARRLGCDLLIKGAFTQNRLRQMIFGGATQHIMARATLPVLLAH